MQEETMSSEEDEEVPTLIPIGSKRKIEDKVSISFANSLVSSILLDTIKIVFQCGEKIK